MSICSQETINDFKIVEKHAFRFVLMEESSLIFRYLSRAQVFKGRFLIHSSCDIVHRICMDRDRSLTSKSANFTKRCMSRGTALAKLNWIEFNATVHMEQCGDCFMFLSFSFHAATVKSPHSPFLRFLTFLRQSQSDAHTAYEGSPLPALTGFTGAAVAMLVCVFV